MLFQKGQPRPQNAGRKAGSKNRITKALKEMILDALDDAGGQAYLARQAVENPAAFLTLVGKVLPLTVHGDRDQPLEFKLQDAEENRDWVIAQLDRLEEAERAAEEVDRGPPRSAPLGSGTTGASGPALSICRRRSLGIGRLARAGAACLSSGAKPSTLQV
jgi:hypothetical protein